MTHAEELQEALRVFARADAVAERALRTYEDAAIIAKDAYQLVRELQAVDPSIKLPW